MYMYIYIDGFGYNQRLLYCGCAYLKPILLWTDSTYRVVLGIEEYDYALLAREGR